MDKHQNMGTTSPITGTIGSNSPLCPHFSGTPAGRQLVASAGRAAEARTSSMRTGRCSRDDHVQASATHSVSRASAIVHGDGRTPATTSVNAVSSAR